MVRLPNISIENGEKKLTLSQVVERTRLLIYIPKDICNSCLISLFEEIGRHLTKNIWNKIVIIKTVNLDNEIDFSSIGMKQYYTSFELNFILENNISNKVVLMVIDNNLKISMVHIPSDVIDARTTNFLQIVREYDEFKEEAN
jgi:hypothetical protein